MSIDSCSKIEILSDIIRALREEIFEWEIDWGVLYPLKTKINLIKKQKILLMEKIKDIIVRLEQMNKRYIRKLECKQVLEDAIKEIINLRQNIDNMYDEIAYNNQFPQEE